MSVERNIEGKLAAVTWWVDDILMDEGAPRSTRGTLPLTLASGTRLGSYEIESLLRPMAIRSHSRATLLNPRTPIPCG